VGAGLGVVEREGEAEGGVAVRATADWVGQARQIFQIQVCNQPGERLDGCRPAPPIGVVPAAQLLGQLEQQAQP